MARAYTTLLRSLLQESPGLLALLPKRPQELHERVSGYVDEGTEIMFGKRPNYNTVDWEYILLKLEVEYGSGRRILEEAALAEVADFVRRVLGDIRPNDAFNPIWAADSLQAHCCYLVCRLLKPEVVVETGVAFGTTSVFILKALEKNGHGTLHSIDFPPLMPKYEESWGILVDEPLKEIWRFHRGSSKQLLPKLLNEVGTVDLFVHDSLHTYRNMLREFETVWPRLRPGGMIISDDVDYNEAFGALRRQSPSLWHVVSDLERQPLYGKHKPTTFGIATK